MMYYDVYDQYGNFLRRFTSSKEAATFKAIMGRFDWKTKQVKQIKKY